MMIDTDILSVKKLRPCCLCAAQYLGIFMPRCTLISRDPIYLMLWGEI